MSQPTYLSLADASAKLGVHPETLRRWSDDGQIACMRTVGGHRRFALADVDALRERLTTPAGEPEEASA